MNPDDKDQAAFDAETQVMIEQNQAAIAKMGSDILSLCVRHYEAVTPPDECKSAWALIGLDKLEARLVVTIPRDSVLPTGAVVRVALEMVHPRDGERILALLDYEARFGDPKCGH